MNLADVLSGLLDSNGLRTIYLADNGLMGLPYFVL